MWEIIGDLRLIEGIMLESFHCCLFLAWRVPVGAVWRKFPPKVGRTYLELTSLLFQLQKYCKFSEHPPLALSFPRREGNKTPRQVRGHMSLSRGPGPTALALCLRSAGCGLCSFHTVKHAGVSFSKK